jgi:predicted phage-related endonuclease
MNAPVSHRQITDAEFRATHVGASEVAALFDCSPWLTRFELFHRKAGNIATPEFNEIADDGTPENERIYWGVRLEAAIIEAAKERYGYIDRPPADPPLSNGRGLGGHPDRRVICPKRGPGIIETKMVDWLVRKSWGDEPPMNYLLQGNTYAGLDNVEWFDTLVLVGGNKLERFCNDFRPKLYAEAERRVEAFWQTVRDNKPPPADFTRDLDPIKELYAAQGDETIDLVGDNRAAIAAAEYLAGAEIEREGKARKEAAAAELFDKLREASFAFADGFTIKSTLVKAIPERVAEPGEIISGRKSYRRLTIKEKTA